MKNLSKVEFIQIYIKNYAFFGNSPFWQCLPVVPGGHWHLKGDTQTPPFVHSGWQKAEIYFIHLHLNKTVEKTCCGWAVPVLGITIDNF